MAENKDIKTKMSEEEQNDNMRKTENSADTENITDETKDEKAGAGENGNAQENENSKNEGETTDADQPETEVEELKAKVDELNDKYLRLFSEFDNYRKRTLKEKIEYSKIASSDVITALLPVYDDLARACEMAEDNQKDESFAKGVFLIFAKFKSILTQKGVEEIPALGEDFNTDFHEAISNIEAKSDSEKGKIIEEVEKGYTLHGKVLRFAKVVVAN